MSPHARGATIFVALIAFALGAIVATEYATHAATARHRDETTLANITGLLPPRFDNSPVTDSVLLPAQAELGTDTPQRVYRARLAGQPAGVVLRLIAPDGYNGPIALQVGLDAEGRILGVRVIEHHETPGLGANIDPTRGNWLRALNGRSLGDPAPAQWRVRRDGGDFDQLAGATQTPRAIIAALRRGLSWYLAQRDALFAAPAS